jgi:putative ABC transport system ATP-binding protein
LIRGKAAPVNMNKIEPTDGFLRLDNLSKSFHEGEENRIVLQNATLHIAPGEITAILGKSGSGKTTLLNMVSGIDKADQGEVVFNGRRLSSLGDRDLTLFRRKNIGFIFQFFNLIPTLTVWENVILPLELNSLFNDVGRSYAVALLEEVGLLTRRKTFPDRLSGGEQQRVAIARALVHNPALVLADEPTGNLDEHTGKQVLDLLERLTHKSGKNLILVTHNPEAARIADRVYLLHEGILVLERSV